MHDTPVQLAHATTILLWKGSSPRPGGVKRHKEILLKRKKKAAYKLHSEEEENPLFLTYAVDISGLESLNMLSPDISADIKAKPLWLMYNCRFGTAMESKGVGLGSGEFLPWTYLTNLVRSRDDKGTAIILTYGIDAFHHQFSKLGSC